MSTDFRVHVARAVFTHDFLGRAFDRCHQFRQEFILEGQERFYGFDGLDDEVPGSQWAVGSNRADRAGLEDEFSVLPFPLPCSVAT